MTSKQFAAYKEIRNRASEEHLRKTYGMTPISARFAGTCGCGRIFGEGSGWTPGTYCRFDKGAQIARFRDSWWNLACIDRIRLEEFQKTARFTQEVKTRTGWRAIAWTNDLAEAARWTRLLADLQANGDYLDERVHDRTETEKEGT